MTVELERDPYGRVLRETQGERWIKSWHDARGLRVKRQTDSRHECEWQWDANGQASGLRIDGDDLLEFMRDAGGREVERRMRGGLVLRQQYDALDRLVSQWAGLEADRQVAAVVDREFHYDASGDATQIRDARWGESWFRYDRDGRIAHAQRERGKGEQFQYDAAGNIAGRVLQWRDPGSASAELVFSLRTRFYGEHGRLERVGETSYLWDQNGRLIEKQEGGRRWRYQWAAEGTVQSVTTPEGERWRYQYDAFGRRVRKTGPGGTTTYVWDGAAIAEEIREGQATAAWVWEQGSFRPLVKHAGGRPYVCITDQVGTPRELVGADGKVAWSTQLTTWGELEHSAANKTDCPIRFQGQWFDAESGLHYNYHRYYDPEIGQYLSPDPMGLDGGTRPYGYVHNPLSWVDPLGLEGGCNLPQGRQWKFNPSKDLDWRGTGKTYQEAVDEAFQRTGVPRDQFEVTKWGVDQYGKDVPVEWTGPKGASVNVDKPVWQSTESGMPSGPQDPHVGYQTPGKGPARIRGHIILDDVPATRPPLR